jgi:hypothetical protein
MPPEWSIFGYDRFIHENRSVEMKTNVGGIDKVLRIIIGLALIGWGIWAKNWLGAIGVIPLFTALMGWCPLYSIIGLNTKKLS